MEVFKFGFYSIFPLAWMLYFGDPDWYQKYVLPSRDDFSKPEFIENVTLFLAVETLKPES